MALDLTTWYNSNLGFDKSIKSQEYSLTFDKVLGVLSEKYYEGKQETFPTISRMAQRITKLHREDHSIRFTNGNVCQSDNKGYVDGESFVQLFDNFATTGRRLTESEFSQLTHEVLTTLEGK